MVRRITPAQRAFDRIGRVLVCWVLACWIVGCQAPELERLKAENATLRLELETTRTQLDALETTVDQTPAQEAPATSDRPRVQLANTETLWLEPGVATAGDDREPYQVKVWLPRGYHDTTKTYPMLVVTDAETNFGGVSYITQRLIKDEQIPEILLVGVAYDTDYDRFYQLRSRDLTPTHDPNFRRSAVQPSGQAEAFATLLEEQLFPFVAEHYRVDLDDRALYGHSFGGLFGTYMLLHRPQLFHRYLLLSPSLWWHDGVLFDRLATVNLAESTRTDSTVGASPRRVFFASGELERRIAEDQTRFVEQFRPKTQERFILRAQVLDGETHRTVFGRGFTNGLRFLYADD